MKDPDSLKEKKLRFGVSKHLKAANHMHTSKNWHILLHRLNEELMILGFLAFMVWGGTQAELWQKLVPPNIVYENTPQTWHEMLELVEDVHIHLFIAMVLHFIVVGRVVWNCAYLSHVAENIEVFTAAGIAEAQQTPWEGFPLRELAPKWN